MRLWPSVAGTLLGIGLLAISLPATAGPFGGASKSLLQAKFGENSTVVQVQYRRGPRRGGYRRGSRGDGGAAAAGVLGGLFLGAIIASEAQRQQSVDYCIQRFRSYDPRSGTYLGYDGRRHRCP